MPHRSALGVMTAYQASGRTYVVSDPDEAWLLSVVRGRHWLAWRVPDDEVCVLPNRFIVVDYAASRGWYDPRRDGAFDFARAYADPRVAQNPTNYGRQWAGLRHFAEAPPGLGPDLPTSSRRKTEERSSRGHTSHLTCKYVVLILASWPGWGSTGMIAKTPPIRRSTASRSA